MRLTPLMIIFFGAMLMVTTSCNSQSQYREKLSAEEWKQDLKQLRKLLETNHPQLYRFTSRNDFESMYTEVKGAFNDSVRLEETLSYFTEIVGLIGCGHSRIRPPAEFWNNHLTGYIPLDVEVVDDRIFVKQMQNNPESMPVGSEILTLQNLPVAELLQDLRKHSTGDGLWKSGRNYYIRRYFSRRVAAQFGFPENYEVTFRKPDSDQVVTLKIKSVLSNQIPVTENPVKDFELQTGWPDQTTWLAVRTFAYYDQVEAFRAFIDSSFTEIHKTNTRNLILDLRGNSGGDPHCSTHLFSYLIDQPVPYFGAKLASYAAYAEPIPVAENRFEGNLYVLIDGGCFSTTGHICGLLKYHDLCTFIGEETGGTYTCNDGTREYTLKNSRCTLQVARMTFFTATEGLSWAEGIKPDYPVFPSAQDIVAGNDATLDFTKQLIHRLQQQE